MENEQGAAGAPEQPKKPPRKRARAKKSSSRKKVIKKAQPTIRDDAAAAHTFLGKVGTKLQGWWQYKAFRIGVAILATLLLLWLAIGLIGRTIDRRVNSRVEALRQQDRDNDRAYIDSMNRVSDSLIEVDNKGRIVLDDMRGLDSANKAAFEKKTKVAGRNATR